MKNLIYGVGYNSRGKHQVKKDGKNTAAYSVWQSMLRRCYCPKHQETHPTYIGCAVAKHWHDFQGFADWYVSHKYSGLGYQLDKDVLNTNNRMYSPETCCLLPKELNMLFTDSSATRGDLPQGVYFDKHKSRYVSRLRIGGKSSYLGSFDCPNKAYQAYKIAKVDHVKAMALKWQHKIDSKAFHALMNWSL